MKEPRYVVMTWRRDSSEYPAAIGPLNSKERADLMERLQEVGRPCSSTVLRAEDELPGLWSE